MQSYEHFTLEERENLQLKLREKKSLRQIARELNKNVSSISRELKRNKNRDGSYHPWRATVLYIVRRKNSRRKYRIESDLELRYYVESCMEKYWSPEIITMTWKAQKDSNKLSHTTIYTALKKRLMPGYSPKTHLRHHGKRKQTHNCYTIHPDCRIGERPEEANLRLRFGDIEGDTVYGSVGKGYLVTCVDRYSRKLYAAISKTKQNDDINAAFKKALAQVKCLTLTLDNGSEFGGFRNLEKDLNTVIYFADPHSPWQRGSNENLNGLIRFFFPKGTDFSKVSEKALNDVIDLINSRPRKCLGWLSPNDFLKKCCT